jgi:hypothetical protein
LLKIMLPMFHGDLASLIIFRRGVVTYVCMVSFYFFNGIIEVESLITFHLYPYIFLSLDFVCILKEKNVKCLKLF